MKRILSITAIVALLVSMFSGVAFAAKTKCKIIVDNDVIELTGNKGESVRITGRLVDSNGATVYNADDVKVRLGSLRSERTEDGSFKITIFRSMLDVGVYEITFDNNDDYEFDHDSKHNKVRVIPEISMSDANRRKMEWELPIPTKGIIDIGGGFPNEDGESGFDLNMYYVAEDGVSSTGSKLQYDVYQDEDSFGFMIDPDRLQKKGEIGIFADDALVYKGKISAANLDVAISSRRIPRLLGMQPIVFDFNLSSKYTEGSKLEDDYKLKVSARSLEDDDFKDLDNTIVSDYTAFDDSDNQIATWDFDCEDWPKGDVELTVSLTKNNNVIMEKVQEVQIVTPQKYTLVGWGQTSRSVGDFTLVFPRSSSGSFPSSNGAQKVEVLKYSSKYGVDTCEYVEVIAKGCGVEKTLRNFGEDAVKDHKATISPNKTGKLNLTINVYSSESDKSPDKTFKEEINITGYNITYNRDSIEVESEPDFIVTVTDENGDPVNNAIIKLDEKIIVNGNIENINDGNYIYRDDEQGLFSRVGSLTLKVSGYHHGESMAVAFEDAIEVVGENVYTVTSETEVLVNGTEETVYVSTIDDYGNVIHPTYEQISIDKDGNKSKPKNITRNTYKKDIDKLKVSCNKDQVSMIIRAVTDGGKKMGQLTLKVLPPQVKMQKSETATENIKSDIKFTIVDPRNGDVLSNDIYFLANNKYVDYSLKEHDGSVYVDEGKSSSCAPNSDDEYSFTILVDDVDWEKAENDEVEPTIDLYLESSSDNSIKMLAIPIKKPTIVTNPKSLVSGHSSQVTITYLDGDENPLVGYEMVINGEELGDTNSDGQVFYVGMGGYGAQYMIKADTDDHIDDNSEVVNPSSDNKDTTETEYRLKTLIDNQGPSVEYPEIVNTRFATITIRDEARVKGVMIISKNGKRKLDIWPTKVVTEQLELKVGKNNFTVEALDSNDAHSINNISIVYDPNYDPNAGTTPTPNPNPDPDPTPTPIPGATVTFSIGVDSGYGAPALKLVGENNITMVPVRFAEDLGASVKWDQPTKTAIYVLGDTEVRVTLNKAYAVVNGKNVLLASPAYLNSQGRTMVPLRMIAQELGYKVDWKGFNKPIRIFKEN